MLSLCFLPAQVADGSVSDTSAAKQAVLRWLWIRVARCVAANRQFTHSVAWITESFWPSTMLDCIFLSSQMCDFSTSNASMRHLEAWVISRAPTGERNPKVLGYGHMFPKVRRKFGKYIRTTGQLVNCWKVTLAEKQPQSIHVQQQPAAKQQELKRANIEKMMKQGEGHNTFYNSYSPTAKANGVFSSE